MWVLAVVLVEYGINENRLRVWEKVDWMVCHTCNISIFWVWAIQNQWLWVSSAMTVHTLRKKKRLKVSVPVLTILPNSLVPWRSLNWQNVLVRDNIFGVDCGDGCTQNEGGEKLLSYVGGSVSGDCRDDFVNKEGWNRDVRIDWKVACLTRKVLWSVYSLITNLIGFDLYMIWYIQYLWWLLVEWARTKHWKRWRTWWGLCLNEFHLTKVKFDRDDEGSREVLRMGSCSINI